MIEKEIRHTGIIGINGMCGLIEKVLGLEAPEGMYSN